MAYCSQLDSHSSRGVVTNTLTRSRAHWHCGELAIKVLIGLHRIGFIVPYVAVRQLLSKEAFQPKKEATKAFSLGVLSVTLSVAFRPPAFRWYPFPRCPDFPLTLILYKTTQATARSPATKIFVTLQPSPVDADVFRPLRGSLLQGLMPRANNECANSVHKTSCAHLSVQRSRVELSP
jgi:hypothetical protein